LARSVHSCRVWGGGFFNSIRSQTYPIFWDDLSAAAWCGRKRGDLRGCTGTVDPVQGGFWLADPSSCWGQSFVVRLRIIRGFAMDASRAEAGFI